jgi:hypothetical protein
LNNLITTSTNALSLIIKDGDFPLRIETEVETPLGKQKKIYILSKTDTGALKMEVEKSFAGIDINK